MAARTTPSLGGKPDKRIRDALLLESMQIAPPEKDAKGKPIKGPRGETYMRRIARKIVEKAAAGDMDAVKEYNNRVDGKSIQPMANDPTNPLFPTDPDKPFTVQLIPSKPKR